MKPKFHIMAELRLFMAHAVGDTNLLRCYLDEDVVGHIGKTEFSMGGKRIASTTPTTVLRKYGADNA